MNSINILFKASTPFFSLFLLVCNYINCKTNVVTIEASLLDSFTISANKVEIKIQVNNFSGSALQIPDVLFWGLKNDPYADFFLEMEKKDSAMNFTNFAIPDNYHPRYKETVLKKLNDKDSLNDSFNIAVFYAYQFPKGGYRTRVFYKISKHNPISDIYSNWVAFTIR